MIPREETIREILAILNKDRDDFRDGEALIYLYQNGDLDIRQYKALCLKGAGYGFLAIAKELVNLKTNTRGISFQLAKSIYNSGVFRVKWALAVDKIVDKPNHKRKLEFTDSVFKKMFDVDNTY